MKGTFDVQKSWFRVRVNQMLFDFDFRPVHRLTGVTAGRSHRQWRFRFIGRSRTLIVYVANGATTNTAIDAAITASNDIATAVDATVTASDAIATAVDATVTASNAIATAGDATTTATAGDANATADDTTTAADYTTATAGDANATAVDAIATFRHRHLLL